MQADTSLKLWTQCPAIQVPEPAELSFKVHRQSSLASHENEGRARAPDDKTDKTATLPDIGFTRL